MNKQTLLFFYFSKRTLLKVKFAKVYCTLLLLIANAQADQKSRAKEFNFPNALPSLS